MNPPDDSEYGGGEGGEWRAGSFLVTSGSRPTRNSWATFAVTAAPQARACAPATRTQTSPTRYPRVTHRIRPFETLATW